MSIKRNWQRNQRDLFWLYYQIERSIIFGLILTAIFWQSDEVSGDNLILIFLTGWIIYYCNALYRFRKNTYPKSSKLKFSYSLDDLFIVFNSRGLELTKWSEGVYIFRTKYWFFQNAQIVVKDSKKYCEIIAPKPVNDYLSENITLMN